MSQHPTRAELQEQQRIERDLDNEHADMHSHRVVSLHSPTSGVPVPSAHPTGDLQRPTNNDKRFAAFGIVTRMLAERGEKVADVSFARVCEDLTGIPAASVVQAPPRFNAQTGEPLQQPLFDQHTGLPLQGQPVAQPQVSRFRGPQPQPQAPHRPVLRRALGQGSISVAEQIRRGMI